MASLKRTFPSKYDTKIFPSNALAESFPFYIKECGYCDEKKVIFGQKNSYKDYLLLYSIEGNVRYTKSATTNYLQPNTIVVTACNTQISFTRISKNWRYFYFIIGGSHAKLFYNMVRTQNNTTLNNPFTSILDSFIELYDINCNSKEIYNENWTFMHSSQLLHNIFTSLYDLVYDVKQLRAITPFQETGVNIALKYIEDHYQDALDIDTICSNIGFSKYYFCKIFKKQMGITVHQYVNEYRINKSKELLAYTKLSVTSIATKVGFKTTLTFLRAFEKSVHMTPTEYREYY